jgi:Arc/MetJ-type ribon-helix-helix transcriptional regulator
MARTTTAVVRRSIELTPKTAERLDRLRENLEATSDTEVIRRALQVLEALVDDEKAGRELQVRDRSTGETTSVRIFCRTPAAIH